MAGKKGKKKPNKKQLLTKFSKGGFSKKEVKKISKKLKIKPKKAAQITKRFAKNKKKNSLKTNINAKTNFSKASSTQGPLKAQPSPRVKDIQKEASLLGIAGTLPPRPSPTPPRPSPTPPRPSPTPPRPSPTPPRPSPTPPTPTPPTPTPPGPTPTPPGPSPTPPAPPPPLTIPEEIKAEAPNLTGPNTPTTTQTPYIDNTDLINQLMGQYDNSAYMDQIKGLQGTISNLETSVGGYQTALNTLGNQYKNMELNKAQFKVGDSKYLSDNNSRGVRLRRSKNKNLFALGTGQFNRKNRNKQLAIGNVNL